MKNKSGTDLTEGPIFKKLILFVLPIIATSVLQQFYTTADQIVVGKFAGDTALAAVGSTGYVTNLLLNLFIGLSVGATVTCAKFCGAKDKERISNTVHTSIALAISSGLFLAVIGISLSRPLMEMMNTPADVIDHSVNYMSIIFAGSPFSLVYNFGSGILKASGDTKRPLYILTVSGIVNVLLNLVFVVGVGLAEAGVAFATVISQMISAVSVLVLMLKKDDDLKLVPRKIRFHKDELINIIKVGVPSGLNAILYNIANITLQSTINSFGKEFMAASTAGNNISHYISSIQSSVASGTISFVGQNYGAKKFKRIHRVVGISILTALAVSVGLALLVAVFPHVFLGFFTTEEAVVQKGIGKTVIVCLGYILNVPTAMLGAALRAMEKSSTPMILNIVSVCISRLAWIWWVFPLFPAGSMLAFNMLFVCYPVSWGLSSIAMTTAYYYYKKRFPETAE